MQIMSNEDDIDIVRSRKTEALIDIDATRCTIYDVTEFSERDKDKVSL
jgi:hypothetical protein